jgi:YesN/AraC family two-component response regulator
MKTKSILIVDDEILILKILYRELTLSDMDIHVEIASSGKDAMNKIQSKYYDLVVLDINMPEINGFEVLKFIKEKNIYTMVIILTGYADLKYAIEAMRLGSDDFLQKPCDIEELQLRIAKCFEKQELWKKISVYETFLPVCSYCKKIRDDREGKNTKGKWLSLEEFFTPGEGISITHGCCPDCYGRIIKEENLDKK